MPEHTSITISYKRKKIEINIEKIVYILMKKQNAEIHVYGGRVYTARITCEVLKGQLGENFLEVRRGCLVTAMAISSITDKVLLITGEELDYTARKKKQILSELQDKRRTIISGFPDESIPVTAEEYRQYYSGFAHMPFGFADIEMVFSEEHVAVDWIFRYGNDALAEIERTPLEKLIGCSFGTLFENMEPKWLQSYERSALYGEILEIIDYSPEVDRYLKIICFPTFRGHCGCILFDVHAIQYSQANLSMDNLLRFLLGGFPKSGGIE